MPYDELAAEVATEVRLLRAIQAELAAHAAAREQHYRQVDPGQLARSLPGFAEISAPVLVAAMGRPGRFRDGTRFKSYVGLAPRASETGETDRKGQPMSKAGPSQLRSAFVRAADTARRQDPQLARIYYLQMTERGATHLKACCVVAGHLAERAWTVLNRGTPYVICDTNGNPVTAEQATADHRGEMDRPRGRPQTPPQPQDSGEGPSGGHNRAGQARRPSPPPIVAAPPPGRQPRHLTPGRPPGRPASPARRASQQPCPSTRILPHHRAHAAAARPCQRARIPPERITTMPEPGIVLDPDQAEELRELITLTAIVQEWLRCPEPSGQSIQ